jgi:hypothetical protein
LQGAVRLHGLASSPTPDTHVRGAWALAGCTPRAKDAAARTIRRSLFLDMGALSLQHGTLQALGGMPLESNKGAGAVDRRCLQSGRFQSDTLDTRIVEILE